MTQYIVPGVLIALALIVLFNSFFTIDQQNLGVIQRLGKFVRFAHPGLNIKIPFIESVVEVLDLRVQQLNVEVETKTKDNVFVRVGIAVQYCILKEKAYDAYYQLSNPEQQIESYIFDSVRAKVPTLELDNVFENKDEIANDVNEGLSEVMTGFGYNIVKALVTDIDPDEKVKESMNDINAAQRQRVAATERGEAERILLVAQAKAEAESKKLQGEGIANQRKAIAEGLRESVETLQEAVPGSDANTVMEILLLTQYFDTMREMSQHSQMNTIFLSHTPGGLHDLREQIRNGTMEAHAGLNGNGPSKDPAPAKKS